MGLPGMVLSGIAAVVGAIMYFATTAQNSSVVQNHGFRLSTVGVILMVAGAIGFVVSLIVFAMSNRSAPTATRTIDRTTSNEAGETTSMHEQRN